MSIAPETTAPEVPGRPIGRSRPRLIRRSASHLWRLWNDAKPFAAPPRSEWPVSLRRARTVGFCLLGVQLAVLLWFTALEANRDALTRDFTSWQQAVYLISQGHLDPYSTTLAHAFWHDHSEFIAWPLAILELLWPHPETLKWAQDLAAVGAEAVALAWISDIAAVHARRRGETRMAVALVGLGALFLATNPWTVWTVAYDIHAEAFTTVFLLLTARDLFRGRRTAWLWAVLTLSTGDVAASYLGALGVSAMLSGRWCWRRGAVVGVLGVGWLIVLGAIHGSQGTPLGAYQALLPPGSSVNLGKATAATVVSAAATHPARVIRALWSNKLNLWADVSPTGLIGMLWLPLMVPSAMVLVEGGLAHGGLDFSLPGFQNFTVVPLSAIGAIACYALIAGRLGGRRPWLPKLIVTLAALNTLFWAVVWLPQTSGWWLRVSPGAAAVLHRVLARIGPNDEVIAEQGVAGAFADRPYIYPQLGAGITVPIRERRVWFVFAPNQGIETAHVAPIFSDIRVLAADPAVHLVAASDGIYAFEWTPPREARMLTVDPGSPPVTAAWEVAGVAGTIVRPGDEADWYISGNGHRGYVLSGDYWQASPGAFDARVRLASSGPVNVEVWNATSSTLLTRQTLPGTVGRSTITLSGQLPTLAPTRLFNGWGPWTESPYEPVDDQLEVRVWSPGGPDQVTVYSISMRTHSRQATPQAVGVFSVH